jgi:hypothetical protein
MRRKQDPLIIVNKTKSIFIFLNYENKKAPENRGKKTLLL